MTERFKDFLTQSPEKEKTEIFFSQEYPAENNSLKRRYDTVATKWNERAYEGTRNDYLINRLIEAVDMSGERTVLEVMCGTANLSQELRQTSPGGKFFALDFSQGMLNTIPEGIERVHASVIAMPFEDGVFNIIFMRSAIHDLPKVMQLSAMREIWRVLKADGVFVMQSYVTEPETHAHLNEIVNVKDIVAGQYQNIGKEYPRYFRSEQEMQELFEQSGFVSESIAAFKGRITYLQTDEMPESIRHVWTSYVAQFPKDIKAAIELDEEGGTFSYSFPGQIYRLSKSPETYRRLETVGDINLEIRWNVLDQSYDLRVAKKDSPNLPKFLSLGIICNIEAAQKVFNQAVAFAQKTSNIDELLRLVEQRKE